MTIDAFDQGGILGDHGTCRAYLTTWRSPLLPALRETLKQTDRGDFCVGYFNLRGWKSIDDLIERWTGQGAGQCRLLVGMQRLPQDELRLKLSEGVDALDNQTVLRLKRKLARNFALN